MKILQVNDYGFRIGGAEQYFFAIAAELECAGCIVKTVSSNRNNTFEDFVSDHQVMQTGHCLNLDGIFQPVNFFQLRKIVQEFKPEVVHFHNIFYALSASAIFAAGKTAKVMTLHDYKIICHGDKRLINGEICTSSLAACRQGCQNKQLSVKEKLQYQVQQQALKRIKTFIAPSKFLQNEFSKNGYSNVSYLSHPSGFNANINATASNAIAPDERRDFLYIGRLAEQKGLWLLVKAFLSLPKCNQRLHIAGTGPLFEPLKKFILEQNASEQIIMHGFVAGDEKINLIKSCIANILPALWPEVFGLSIAEAACLATPSIVSSAGALPENITDEKTGLIFERNNQESLREKLLFAINEPKKMLELGEQAARQAKQYDLSQHVKDLIMLYKA